MTRTVRVLTRSMLALVTVLTLAAALAQPAPMLRAQEDPLPTPTVSTTEATVGAPASSEPQIAIVNADGSVTYPADSALSSEIAPVVVPDTAAVPQAQEPAAPAAPGVAPQAGTPITPFLVNVVSSATARSGTDLTYTIFFTNTGNTTYNNVLLQNNLGVDEFFLGCTGSNLSTCPFVYNGTLSQAPVLQSVSGNQFDINREFIWRLGTVAPGQLGRISYTLRIGHNNYPLSGRAPRVLGNTVALYKDNAISTANKLNEDQWGVLIVGPVFYISKSGTPGITLQGDTINYEITIGNATGPEDKLNGQIRSDARTATKIKVFDPISDRLDPATISFPVGSPVGTYNAGERRIYWDLGSQTLAPGATPITLRFSAKVRSDDAFIECNDVLNRGYATSDEIPRAYESGLVQYIEGQVEARSLIYPPATLQVGHSPGNVYAGLPGEPATWTIVANNFWKTEINGAAISWYLPSNFTYVSSNPPGTYDNNNRKVVWSNLRLPIKTSFSSPGQIQLTVTARAGRTIEGHNSYTEFTMPAGVPKGCLRGVNDGIGVEPLIVATKSVDVTTPVMAGTNVVYTVDLYNRSSQTMTGVTLFDKLPILRGRPFIYQAMMSGGGPIPVSISPLNPQPGQQQELRWENLTIPGGSPSNPGKSSLRFIVEADGTPNDCGDNRVFPDSPPSQGREAAGATVCIDFPFYVVKTTNRSVINPRDSNRLVEFTLRYVNRTSSSQLMTPRDRWGGTPFIFKRMLIGPDGTTAPSPTSTTPINGFLSWPAVTLPANATLYYKYEVELPSSGGLIPTGLYCNRGELWPEPNDQFGWIAFWDACVAVSSIELDFRKEIFGRDVVGLGELVTYKLKLENRSSDTIRSLVVSDTLPVNMTYIETLSGSPTPEVTKLVDGRYQLRWQGLEVLPNTTREIFFRVRAPALIGFVMNEAEVTGGEPLPAFRCDAITPTGCIGRRNLDVRSLIAIGPLANPATTDPGQDVTYTLTLASNNNIPYENVIISDTLPLGFTFVKMISGPPPAQPRAGLLVWKGQKVPEVGSAEKGRLTFVFQARAPQAYGVFTSRIEAASTTGTIPTVDNAAAVLIGPTSPAVSIVAPRLVNVGSDVRFLVQLLNPEATPVDNVTVNVQLPEGFTFNRTDDGTAMPTVNGRTLTWSGLTMPAANGMFSTVQLNFYATAPSTIGTYIATVTATGSKPIDDTHNDAEIIVAKLRYLYLAIIGNT